MHRLPLVVEHRLHVGVHPKLLTSGQERDPDRFPAGPTHPKVERPGRVRAGVLSKERSPSRCWSVSLANSRICSTCAARVNGRAMRVSPDLAAGAFPAVSRAGRRLRVRDVVEFRGSVTEPESRPPG